MDKDPNAVERLTRLEQYLREDPNNLTLLEDAFQTACAAGEWSRARFHLRHASALGVSGPAVMFRECQLDLATHQWADAQQRLQTLRGMEGLSPEALDAVDHDLAYTAFRRGDLSRARDLLATRMTGGSASSPVAFQVLWLRVLHHAGDLDSAVAWARERAAEQALAPEAAGVASLAALDQGDLAVAKPWAMAALEANRSQMEALVTLGTLALAERDPSRAEALLRNALSVHGEDGRAWSALGFVHLLTQRLDDALFDFHRAVQFMPDHVGTWNGLGWTNIVRRDMVAAQQAFERAIALDRNFGESHGGLAVAHAFQGKREEAEQEIARADGLDNANLASHYARAVLNGDVRDVETLQRLAARLLARRQGPTGEPMADWIQAATTSVIAGSAGESTVWSDQ